MARPSEELFASTANKRRYIQEGTPQHKALLVVTNIITQSLLLTVTLSGLLFKEKEAPCIIQDDC